MEDIERKLAIAFEKIYSMDGTIIMDKEYNIMPDAEIGFKGDYVDYYLLLDTISRMLKSGDIKIEVVSNISKKQDYFTRLLEGIQ